MSKHHVGRTTKGIPIHSYYTDACLKCPVCGLHYADIESAYTAVTPTGKPYEGTFARGKVLHEDVGCMVITVCGECCHRWEIRLQFHEGNTFVTTVVIEDDPRIGDF